METVKQVFGVLFLGEPLSLRLLSGAALILGGLMLATLYRAKRVAAPRTA